MCSRSSLELSPGNYGSSSFGTRLQRLDFYERPRELLRYGGNLLDDPTSPFLFIVIVDRWSVGVTSSSSPPLPPSRPFIWADSPACARATKLLPAYLGTSVHSRIYFLFITGDTFTTSAVDVQRGHKRFRST